VVQFLGPSSDYDDMSLWEKILFRVLDFLEWIVEGIHACLKAVLGCGCLLTMCGMSYLILKAMIETFFPELVLPWFVNDR